MGDDWAFVPDPLPPALYGSAELIAALSEADQALDELAGVGRALSDLHLLIAASSVYSHRRRKVAYAAKVRRAMEEPTLDTISQSEFEQAIERYTSWAAEWDGALPADVFFGIWADFQHEERQVDLRAR